VSVRLITLMIVGFVVGALAAGGVGVRVIREVRTADDATSLPAQNIARADGYHADPNETLLSSVALIPDAAVFGEDGLVISYDLASLAPSLGNDPSESGPPLFPKRWLVEAVGGEFPGVQDGPGETKVTFPLLAGGSIDQIDTVRIVEAYIPAPFEVPVAISADQSSASVVPGVDIELVNETTDGGTTTIEVRIVSDVDVARDVNVVGDGPRWYQASVDGDSVTLTRDNDDGPAAFDLIVFGTSWVPIDGEFVVNIGDSGE